MADQTETAAPEITDAALAIHNLSCATFDDPSAECAGVNHEDREQAAAAIAAARPILTAEREAEVARLRAELATSRRSETIERGNRISSENDLIAVVKALGLKPDAVLLEDVIERAETLAEWGKTAKAIFGPDTDPAAVLAEPPAPTTGGDRT